MSLELGRSSADRDDADEPGDATAAKPGTRSYQRLWHAADADAPEPDDDPGDPVPDEAAGAVKTGMVQPGSPRPREATAPPKTAALRPGRVRLRQATGPAAPGPDQTNSAQTDRAQTDRAQTDRAQTDGAQTGGPRTDSARTDGAGAQPPADTASPAGPTADEAREPVRSGLGPSEGPLIGDAAALRATWRDVQAAFVDDPREAVSDAADLVEHAAQALAGALQQRQKQLRGQWDDAGTNSDRTGPDSTGPDSTGPDSTDSTDPDGTERLRLVMQQYRALFNQICRP